MPNPKLRYTHVDTIMDVRICSGCKWLYGYGPYQPESAETRAARPRYGETKWCPRCEKPYPVLLKPMIWSGMPIAVMGTTAAPKQKPNIRSVKERMAAIGLETTQGR